MGNSESDYQDETVFKNEELFRIEGNKLNELLHRSVGALTFLDSHKQMGIGNGVLISKDTILTAAHNIFNKKFRAENTGFKFYIGVDGIAENYYEIQTWRYPSEFKTCPLKGRIEFDYAIMKLKKPIEFDRYLTLSIICQKCLPKQKQKFLKVFGFPREYKSNFYPLDEYRNKMTLYQYGLAGQDRIVKINVAQHQIRHGISTLPGQSGCPVVVDDSIIAVHVGGTAEFNIGRIISVSLIKNIKAWARQIQTSKMGIKYTQNCSHIQENIKLIANPQTELYLPSRSLKSVDLSEYANLLHLGLRENKLEAIDLSQCPLLKKLQLHNNHLRSVDLKANVNLTDLDLSSNQLSAIDVSANANLTFLDLSSNKLSAMDVSANINLTQLYLYQNQLSAMDVSANVNLTRLYLEYNQLSAMDVSANINLTHLYLSWNQLSSIELRANTNLQYFWLYNNKIKEIDLSRNTELSHMYIEENRLARIIVAVAGNVPANNYTYDFNLSQQQSAACRVELRCEEAYRGKSADIAEAWRERYSQEENNKHACAYSYQVL